MGLRHAETMVLDNATFIGQYLAQSATIWMAPNLTQAARSSAAQRLCNPKTSSALMMRSMQQPKLISRAFQVPNWTAQATSLPPAMSGSRQLVTQTRLALCCDKPSVRTFASSMHGASTQLDSGIRARVMPANAVVSMVFWPVK